ncbi:MAG: ATP-dependent sacrificial sulfur transferase LarE [Oligoflexia bacterium]|nr:ATP-dependent sacrificial sulfur transferase LarE [Oligoflexia bacterium]
MSTAQTPAEAAPGFGIVDDHRLNQDQRERLLALRDIMAELGSVLVTFSGGVDSALVLRVAHEVLGDHAIALTAVSPTFPPEELDESRRVATRLGVRQILVDSRELENEGYARNSGDRCYFCKSELFALARAKADELGMQWVLDGTITDDLGEHRPGLVAADRAAVRHPLVEAGFDKQTVRAVSRALGLPVWDKPAFACLGSRFPVGTRVTADRIRQVQRVESVLRTFGLRQFRARWHELEGQPMLRLELDPAQVGVLADDALRRAVIEVAKAEGFRWVTLDLEGYTRGNLSLPSTPPAR